MKKSVVSPNPDNLGDFTVCLRVLQYSSTHRRAASSAYGSSWPPHFRKLSAKPGQDLVKRETLSHNYLVSIVDLAFFFYMGVMNKIGAAHQHYVRTWQIQVREVYHLKWMGNLTVWNCCVPQGMTWQHTTSENQALAWCSFFVSTSSSTPVFGHALDLFIFVTGNMPLVGYWTLYVYNFLLSKDIKCIANAFQSHRGSIHGFLCFEGNADIFQIMLQ